MTPTTTHYHILNLPHPSSSSSSSSPSTPLSPQSLKLAYHRALLRHHPDKSSASSTRTKTKTKGATTSSTPTNAPSAGSSRQSDGDARIYTIDEITAAYKTLSDPRARAEYDRELRLSRATTAGDAGVNTGSSGGEDDIFHTGLETVDLEDLGYVDVDVDVDLDGEGDSGEVGGGYWYRSCRCGDEKGFFLMEGDLEREGEAGEILVGCKGCSLWLRVLFAVVEDGDGEEEDGVS
ncbi:Diphthamide biosynthesis protein 4 [Arachnomyces sp. PD_36]|nr:Diphthamide biosynthesis protein 4 [Arachnomyces sp. PD_36]